MLTCGHVLKTVVKVLPDKVTTWYSCSASFLIPFISSHVIHRTDRFWPQTEGVSARRNIYTNEKSHVKLITIDSNGPYERRKRSDWNTSISSVRKALLIFFNALRLKEVSLSCDTYIFWFLLIYSEDVSCSFWSLFFIVFFSVYSVFILMSPPDRYQIARCF